ncbi:MAG TPA: glutamyl-tRNA reductase [Actinomycetota bacterium]|nr:glutamyl-tRNA reductase [Actinomycetota bacterium]
MIVALSAGRDSPPRLRARLAMDEAAQSQLLSGPRPGVGELVILSTCHRTELYATADGFEAEVVHSVAALLPELLPTDQHDVRFIQGSEAIEHLFRVACGLDSLVIGEPQVLGQVRRAYNLASEAGAAGPVMHNIFARAIRLGKQVRSETPLGRLGQSIGSIAADYLDLRLRPAAARSGVVVGAGEAATDAAKVLWKSGAELAIVSRTIDSAQTLASLVGGTAHTLEELSDVMIDRDFAVVAILGGAQVTSQDLPRRTPDDPFIILDLSVPQAVVVHDRDDVELRSLEEIPGPRGPEITDAVIEAEAMVKREVAELQKWADTRESGPAIQDLRSHAEALVRGELENGLSGLQLTVEQRERVEILTRRIVNKLLHGPTTAMRRSDESTRTSIKKLFGLDG